MPMISANIAPLCFSVDASPISLVLLLRVQKQRYLDVRHYLYLRPPTKLGSTYARETFWDVCVSKFNILSSFLYINIKSNCQVFVLNECVTLLGKWMHGFFGMVPEYDCSSHALTNAGATSLHVDMSAAYENVIVISNF
jgi:hypothetical protein